PEQTRAAVNLHYCTASADADPLVTRLQQLTENLPEITLQIHNSQQGQYLTAELLLINQQKVDVWFCGPQGLANTLRSGLKHQSSSLRFHQEVFEFR
ncbi:MAG: ferric reductase, partial [Marinospirillum sp.]|uniref:hypothetical protein n=1 Tax=Marinospirillum sp. TaxID=2183934 RepID=UPI001A022575